MNARLRDILIDIKAAAGLESAQALLQALEPYRRMPQAASNQPLPESFLPQWIAPLGQALAGVHIPVAVLASLQADRLVALRAVAAYAFGLQYLEGAAPELDWLLSERRPEVQTAAIAALKPHNPDQAGRLESLIERWGGVDRPLNERLLAARLLPNLGVDALPRLNHFALSSDPDLRKASVQTLAAIRQHAPAAALAWLQSYGDEPLSSDWVIGHALQGGWADPAAARRLLETARQRFGETRPLRQAAEDYA